MVYNLAIIEPTKAIICSKLPVSEVPREIPLEHNHSMMVVVKQFNAFILSAFYFQALALHLQRNKCLLTHRRKKKSGFFMGKSNKQLSSIIIPTVNIVTNQGFPGRRRGWGNFRTVYDSTLSIGVYMSGLGTISVFYVLWSFCNKRLM